MYVCTSCIQTWSVCTCIQTTWSVCTCIQSVCTHVHVYIYLEVVFGDWGLESNIQFRAIGGQSVSLVEGHQLNHRSVLQWLRKSIQTIPVDDPNETIHTSFSVCVCVCACVCVFDMQNSINCHGCWRWAVGYCIPWERSMHTYTPSLPPSLPPSLTHSLPQQIRPEGEGVMSRDPGRITDKEGSIWHVLHNLCHLLSAGNTQTTLVVKGTFSLHHIKGIRDRIWENPTFCIFHQNWGFVIHVFSIYNVWISMSVYNSTFSELQHIVT